jgi:predicted nucleic acid-binding protein
MISVDTSVWIDHLRHTEAELVFLLGQYVVFMHPMILGELACGNLQNRTSLISLWQGLPRITAATHAEVMYFIEMHHLMGKGVGFIDVHLLCALALEQDAQLWTRDKRLAEVAASLGLRYVEDA